MKANADAAATAAAKMRDNPAFPDGIHVWRIERGSIQYLGGVTVPPAPPPAMAELIARVCERSMIVAGETDAEEYYQCLGCMEVYPVRTGSPKPSCREPSCPVALLREMVVPAMLARATRGGQEPAGDRAGGGGACRK